MDRFIVAFGIAAMITAAGGLVAFAVYWVWAVRNGWHGS